MFGKNYVVNFLLYLFICYKIVKKNIGLVKHIYIYISTFTCFVGGLLCVVESHVFIKEEKKV